MLLIVLSMHGVCPRDEAVVLELFFRRKPGSVTDLCSTPSTSACERVLTRLVRALGLVHVCVPVDSEPVRPYGEDARLFRNRMCPAYYIVPHPPRPKLKPTTKDSSLPRQGQLAFSMRTC